MEILRFESSSPNPKYASHVEAILGRLPDLPVLCARAEAGVASVANVLQLRPSPRAVLLPEEACA
jgi:hypothetical protein